MKHHDFKPYREEPTNPDRKTIDWKTRLEPVRADPGNWWCIGEWQSLGTRHKNRLGQTYPDVEFRAITRVCADGKRGMKLYARTKAKAGANPGE